MNREPIVGALSDDDTQGRRHALGRAGERLAAEYLEQHGVAVLQRQRRCPRGGGREGAVVGKRVELGGRRFL